MNKLNLVIVAIIFAIILAFGYLSTGNVEYKGHHYSSARAQELFEKDMRARFMDLKEKRNFRIEE